MRRWWILALAVALAVMFSRFLMEVVLNFRLDVYLDDWMREQGWAAAFLVVGLLSIDLFLPIPSSLVMVLSGALFGTLVGGVLSLIGSLAGNYVGFELARRYGRSLSVRLVGQAQVESMHRVFSRYGVATIVASRPLPILMETLSVVAGLARLGRAPFLIASAVGTIPVCFAYSYAGTFALRAETVFVAILVIVAVPALVWLAFKRGFGADEPGGGRYSARLTISGPTCRPSTSFSAWCGSSRGFRPL